ncbi:hypothetical protein FEM48_Zijuj06G0164000 [Ziziphus jujuba var. spinosa]|uniref:Protein DETOXIFICATION 14-like n=1 Tax=Ziziphus jujuba var. spinosa TaxID=714518 RepID=A0A978VAC6_ZIZJJ|nr:hypothetical protein FEM48_Zijuj06G0164000 [Ziziphus jujuba var. spinosa]
MRPLSPKLEVDRLSKGLKGRLKINMGERWSVFVGELKRVSFIAAPMVAVTVMQYLLQFASVMMVGHLDELSLSGVSIATSFTSVTGFSFLELIESRVIGILNPEFGLAGALETLCGQAYGAEQYQKLGIYTYASIISLILVCLPISLLWLFTEKILRLTGQDPSISFVAQKYSIYLIPNLFPYAILQSLIRYFQTQGLILPMFFSSLATLCFHVPLCWVLVFKLELEILGAALAINLSYWLNVILLGFYMKFSSSCEKTRAVFSKEVFLSIKEFFRFAIPSATMVCLEWWSYEVLILLSGLVPNPKLETSVLSICFSITYLHYNIPYGFGATASTLVAHELGAGHAKTAKVAVCAVMVLAVLETVIVSATLFFSRHRLGYAFSNDREIVDHVADISPLISLSIIMDGLQVVFSG